MPFESGSISFRLMHASRTLPDDAIAMFAENAAPDPEAVHAEMMSGWVGGRHLLDRNITEDAALYGGYLRLMLLQIERKVPTSLLKAEVLKEEMIRKLARGAEFLARRERKEIREEIQERMLPNMPPQLKAMQMVQGLNSTNVYASCLTDKQFDEFNSFYRHTLGFNCVPMTPENLAMERHGEDVNQWYPSSFAPDVEDEVVDDNIGRDFLTWLWFMSEGEQGGLHVEGQGDVSILIEGPITFTMNGGAGAQETTIRKGNPVASAEACTCLLSGKKLSKATVSLVLHDQVWKTGISADDFVFRSMKLPDPDEELELDAVSRFTDRMMSVELFLEMFMGCYDVFVKQRRDRGKWKQIQGDIHRWASERKGLR